MSSHLPMSSFRRRAQWIAVAGVVAMIVGCTAMESEEVQQKEDLLAAAGFQIKVAMTPDKLLQLQTMRQQQMIRRLHNGKVMYVYADTRVCKCLYYGNQEAYDKYRRLALQQQIAQERLNAAEMNEDAAMNWGAWGPWGPWY